MSVHPSLSSKGKGKRIRSVLKRFERLKELLEKERWKPGETVFGLPKVKTMRWKLKKTKKAAEAEAAAAGEGVAPEAAGEGAPEAAGEKKAPSPKEKTPPKK